MKKNMIVALALLILALAVIFVAGLSSGVSPEAMEGILLLTMS